MVASLFGSPALAGNHEVIAVSTRERELASSSSQAVLLYFVPLPPLAVALGLASAATLAVSERHPGCL